MLLTISAVVYYRCTTSRCLVRLESNNVAPVIGLVFGKAIYWLHFCISVSGRYHDRKSSRYRYAHLVRNIVNAFVYQIVFTNVAFSILLLLLEGLSAIIVPANVVLHIYKLFFLKRCWINRHVILIGSAKYWRFYPISVIEMSTKYHIGETLVFKHSGSHFPYPVCMTAICYKSLLSSTPWKNAKCHVPKYICWGLKLQGFLTNKSDNSKPFILECKSCKNLNHFCVPSTMGSFHAEHHLNTTLYLHI